MEDFDSYPYPDFLLPAYLEASSGKKELKNFSSEKVNPIDQDIKRKILQKLLTKLNFKELSLSQKNVEKLKEKTRQEVYLIFNEFDLSPLQKEKILQEVLDEVLGLGPLESFLKDEEISEIMINGPDQIYIEKKGQIHFSPRSFHSEEQVRSIIERIVAPLGKRVDESSPLVDARLPDGSRVNVILPPLSLKGPIVTIRRFSHKLLTAQNLIEKESLNSAMADFLKAAIQARLNLIVSGGTGSGKTTLLNILSSFIPDEQRIITIEDAAELKLSQSHVIPLESRPPNIEGKGEIPIRILLKNSLRMRPDRIIIGECRGEESLDMLQAMNTGHDGSLTTIHANSPRDCISRLETLVLFSGYKLSTKAIRSQIASAIDLIVQISRFSDGSRKLSQITEITGIEGETISQQDIFYFDQQGVGPDKKVIGRHRATGAIPRFIESLEKKGIPFSMDFFREDL